MANFQQRLVLDPSDYPGGVGLWGALPAIYDTTSMPVEHGVHVHARKVANKKDKEIDDSFGEVEVVTGNLSTKITEAIATPFVGAAVLKLAVRSIACPRCQTLHLDTQRFSVRPHDRHLCQLCGVEFLESERSVGNPVIAAKHALGDLSLSRPTTPGQPGPLRLDQASSFLSGGILIWGSNPAILWTAKKDEADGIHVHAFVAGIAEPVVDETFQAVTIDNIALDVEMVRVFMIQQTLSHLAGSIHCVSCRNCGIEHFDNAAPFAVEPHRNHPCIACGAHNETQVPVVSNPIVPVLAKLYAGANAAGLTKNPLAL